MATSLGTYIRALRDGRHWSQVELAERAELNRAHLSQIESGKIALPAADMRRRIADALGVRHIDLLVAAGELTDDEVAGVSNGPLDGMADDDPRRDLVQDILSLDPSSTSDAEVLEALEVVSRVIRRGSPGRMRGTRNEVRKARSTG